jgi:hypothetical protein
MSGNPFQSDHVFATPLPTLVVYFKAGTIGFARIDLLRHYMGESVLKSRLTMTNGDDMNHLT